MNVPYSSVPYLMNHVFPCILYFLCEPECVSTRVCGDIKCRVRQSRFAGKCWGPFWTQFLVLPTCLFPGTALYLKLCLWSQDQPLEHIIHSSVIAKDQPGWYMSTNQAPGRQVQLMFFTIALFSEPSLISIFKKLTR